MEEVQKNENGTTVPQADRKPEKEKKPKRELTPQQVQQRRKMIVFPLMFLAFAGCMYLIFAPSGKEDVNVESVGGFNADIPLPAEDGIIADKQKAYEQAMLNRKQQDKIQSLQDFGFTGDDETGRTASGNRPDAGRRSEATKGRRCFLFGKRLPGHQPPIKHVLRNAPCGRGKRGLEAAGGGTDRPTATTAECHAYG